MKTLDHVNQELDADIPASAVSTREGGNGRKLSYLSGWYVIDRLNKVFGPLGWATETKELRLVHEGKYQDRYGKDSFHVHYIAQVLLMVESNGARTTHLATGYGDGSDKTNPGKAHELAVKEAETDALKRAAKNLGMSMGLALYNKDQPNVSQEIEVPLTHTEKPLTIASEPHLAVRTITASPLSPDELLERITQLSKVIIKKKLKTKDEILNFMNEKYKVSAKEQLNGDQRQAFTRDLSDFLQ